jgi:hypothetical protein
MFFSLFRYIQYLFLKGSNILSQFGMLLLDKLHLFVGLTSQVIMDELIFNKNLILKEILPQPLLLFVGYIFKFNKLFF